MKHPADSMTLELPGFKSSNVMKKRGRPRVYESAAVRQQAYRNRLGVKSLCVQIPASLHAEFEAWLKFKGKTKSAVIAKLIQTQLLRKR